ncbi:hypothetical protein [Longimicrobium terrae]|uniref:Uncharacterized protein n=1 Tax=Longimicrobium terrae TaxID=1639882 RepID=A0A841GPS7_9BACT|nr:hypothetical protein [Longimicrobium terrae]MBB4634998.1 hypothetical protein [Longimicrobium terrae]MBB6069392.1 hypothetical protein [Longimicrobium terrae]NNC31802.1 hypothetical protein [Longimicrobium terrae]
MTLTYIMFGLLLAAPLVAVFRGGLGEYGVALFTMIPAVLGVLAWLGIWNAHTAIRAGKSPSGLFADPGSRYTEMLIEAGPYLLWVAVVVGIIVLILLFVAGSNALEACQESRRTGSMPQTVVALACQLSAAAAALLGGWNPAEPSRLLTVAVLAAAAVAATFRIIPEPDLPPMRMDASGPDTASGAGPGGDPWGTFR